MNCSVGTIAGWAVAVLSVTAGLSAADDIDVVVRTTAQDRVEGTLIRFALDGELMLRGRKDTVLSIPAPDLMVIETLRETPARPAGPCLILRGGDRLYGRVVNSTPDQVEVETALHQGLGIRLDRLQAYWGEPAGTPRWRKRMDELSGQASEEDRLLLTNGDLMSGFVVRIDPQTVTFEHQDRETTVDMEVVVGLTMATEHVLDPPAAGRARLHFVDGSVLTVSRLQWSPQTLEMTFFDGTLQGLSPQTIQRIELRGKRWQWLSERTPASYRHTPMLDLSWPYRIGRSVTGTPLALGGKVYAHGIGVHSRAVLTYDLNGEFSEFSVLCGLDDSAGPLAHVRAAVRLDRHTRWEQEFTTSTAPQFLRLDVRGVDTLELRVDFGDNGDIQDRFDWAEAALIR